MVDLGVWKEEKDQRRKYESSRASAKYTAMSPRRFICDLMQAATRPNCRLRLMRRFPGASDVEVPRCDAWV